MTETDTYEKSPSGGLMGNGYAWFPGLRMPLLEHRVQLGRKVKEILQALVHPEKDVSP